MSINKNTFVSTAELAKKVRIHVLNMTSLGGSSHIGSAFSIVDILAVLYGKILKYNPSQPNWRERDRFILSKGHAGAAVYATLAEMGFFSANELLQHCQNGSRFSGHISHKNIPGVEISTGSLGHGLGVGVGMSKALKLSGLSSRVFVLLSDGECDEGSTWEAILFAQQHQLDNLVAIIDYNKIQSLGSIAETMELEPLCDKWKSFNWNVLEVDGHNHNNLEIVFEQTKEKSGRPTVVIAHTTKGKGVSFMENTVLWHYRTARGGEFDLALAELKKVP